MAGHKGYAPERMVQVCSIDTLRSRKAYPKADLIIIDEAHQATSPDYLELAEHYAGKFFLPVTATPYGSKSLRHIADKIVHPISVREIIDQGFLLDAKYYAPTTPDLTGVKTRAGEYVESDLEKVMGRAKIVGDVVQSWKKYSNGLATLVFCVSVAHAEILCDEFKKEGVRACVLTAKDSDETRNYRIEDLKTGEIEVICNVGVMGTGVDIPWLRTVVLARPTQSLNLHLQQIGRGSRLYSGKEYFLVLDHAGNLSRHGFMDDPHDVDLDGEKQKFKPSESVTICKVCFGTYRKKESPEKCPYCGAVSEKKTVFSIPENKPGELVELKRNLFEDRERIRAMLRPYFDELPKRKKLDGAAYSPWWVFQQVKKQMGPNVSELVILDEFRREAFKRGYSINKRG
jgi:superfamily II DNA or RNA helicase